jgi:hypothetical protein
MRRGTLVVMRGILPDRSRMRHRIWRAFRMEVTILGAGSIAYGNAALLSRKDHAVSRS